MSEIELQYPVGSFVVAVHPQAGTRQSAEIVGYYQGSGFSSGRVVGIVVRFADNVTMHISADYL